MVMVSPTISLLWLCRLGAMGECYYWLSLRVLELANCYNGADVVIVSILLELPAVAAALLTSLLWPNCRSAAEIRFTPSG